MVGAEEGPAGAAFAVLEGHDERTWHVAWSPCGQLLASCGADKVVRVWRQMGGQWACCATLEDVQTGTIRCCEWSPCGSYLAAASFDKSTALWRRGRRRGSLEMEWELLSSLEGHDNEVKSVSWSADGSTIATCSRDKSVWVWEAPPPGNPDALLSGDGEERIECECISVLSGHSQDVKQVRWHPTEPLIYSVSYDDSARVWHEDTDDWACQEVLVGHTNTVWGLAHDPRGERFATCSQDCTVRIWVRDARSRRYTCGAVLEGRHSRTIFSIDWSPDGRVLATAGADDAVVLHQCYNGNDFPVALRLERAHASDVNCVRWNPKVNGCLATAGDDGLVKVWTLSKSF